MIFQMCIAIGNCYYGGGAGVICDPVVPIVAPTPPPPIYHAATVTWTPVDGVAGYRVYYGSQVVVAGDVSSYTLSLQSGTYEFYVTSYDIYGQESDPSPSVEVMF
jgi:hypothetical protein